MAGEVQATVWIALTIQVGGIARNCSCPPQTRVCMWSFSSGMDEVSKLAILGPASSAPLTFTLRSMSCEPITLGEAKA